MDELIELISDMPESLKMIVVLRLFIDADVPGGFIRFFTRLVSYGCPVEAVLKTVRDEKSDVELAEILGKDLAEKFGLGD